MSVVATESATSSGRTSPMARRVHAIDSESADSALPVKRVKLSSRDHSMPIDVCSLRQQPSERVRRSRRLAEKSARNRSELSVGACHRHPTRQRNQRSHTDGSSSEPVSSSSTTIHPNCPRLPASNLPLGVTSPIDITVSPANAVPGSSVITRSVLAEQDSSRDDQSDSTSISSVQAQAGSLVQVEHSYSITFSSTAQEIPLDGSRPGCLDNASPPALSPRETTPPSSPPTSTNQFASSIPVSVIQDSTATVHTSVPPTPMHGVSTPTEHAQNNMVEVPTSVLRGHPSVESGALSIDTSMTSGPQTADQTERERSRGQRSTVISSHMRDRSTPYSRRRGREREQTDTRELSSTGPNRDRSPIHTCQRVAPSSPQGAHRRRDLLPRPIPVLNTPRVPPPSAVVQPPSSLAATATPSGGVSGQRPPLSGGYQIVPQGQASTSVASNSSPSSLSGVPPLPSVYLSQHHVNAPTDLYLPQLQAVPRPILSSSLLEPVTPVRPPLSESHSGSPFYSAFRSPMSRIPFPSTFSPERRLTSSISSPYQPITITDTPRELGTESPVIVSSSSDRDVPQSFREAPWRRLNNRTRQGSGGPPSTEQGRGGALTEVIILDDSSDSEHEDDDVIVSGVSRISSFTGPSWQPNRRQVSSDETYARRLQEQFDLELGIPRLGHVPTQQTVPIAVPAGPSIPGPNPSRHGRGLPADSGSLLRNNYEALVSHVERLTHNDARRLLNITRNDARQRTGRFPRSREELMRAMENMGEVLIIRTIMGIPGFNEISYEDLLELAETIGPARPQGLPQEVISNIPSREFRRSLDTTSSEEPPKCIVCMSEFEDEERLRSLPCGHEFHQPCIDQWLKDHRTCPICRIELPTQQ